MNGPDDRLPTIDITKPVPPIFDDEYQGPRFRYGLRYRPLSTWNVPAGWIVGSARPHPDFAHGTVDYPREVPPDLVEGYELELVAS